MVSNPVDDMLARLLDSDLWHSFRRSPARVAMSGVLVVLVLMALGANWVAPTTPYRLETLSLMDAQLPPRWLAKGEARFLLGTDSQGRDIYSTILFGTRISLGVGVASVLVALLGGVPLGLVSGYFGGWTDRVIMRLAEVQLAFPAILLALMINGIFRAVLGEDRMANAAIPVLILSIGLSGWVQYARTVRGMTLVERRKEYVQAARLAGAPSRAILAWHILPNVLGPVLVIATIHLAVAIVTEATLSFLGVGTPITEPSLGALIRAGNDYLFSGQWWQVIFPGAMLVLLVLGVNLLGDWLRDYFNPKLR
jgi:peptide/nickel transport system permease protein